MKTVFLGLLTLMSAYLGAQCVTVEMVDDPCLIIDAFQDFTGTEASVASRGIAFTPCADIIIDSIEVAGIRVSGFFSSNLQIKNGYGDGKPTLYTSNNSYNLIPPGTPFLLRYYFSDGTLLTSGSAYTIDFSTIAVTARYYLNADTNPTLGTTSGSEYTGDLDPEIRIWGH